MCARVCVHVCVCMCVCREGGSVHNSCGEICIHIAAAMQERLQTTMMELQISPIYSTHFDYSDNNVC